MEIKQISEDYERKFEKLRWRRK